LPNKNVKDIITITGYAFHMAASSLSFSLFLAAAASISR
jgi:hypothetical protein